ncbi:MAG: methyltransferase [Firmicutes bacterium]|nr:methyltransferase [Bacillota bacterium]
MNNNEEVLHDLLGYDGLKIFQRKDMLSFSLDSALLADFIRITPRVKNIMDFGTGNAPIPLFLSLRTTKPIVGIEILEDACFLAKKSVSYNHLEHQITIDNIDILNVHEHYLPSSFDIISCNPPFYKVTPSSVTNKLDAVSIAKHEVLIDLEQIILQAKRMLKIGGSFHFIHRVERLEEIILLLHKHHFAIKRMRFVYPVKGKKAMMVLLEANNNGKTGSLDLLEPLYIYNEAREYTEDVLKIFRIGKG